MKKRFVGFIAVLALFLLPVIANAASVDDLWFNEETGTITYCNSDAEGELVIPAEIDGVKVTSIGDYAFQGCSGLTSIRIPDSVTSIGDGAFYVCTGLTSISIPDSVTSISDSAFMGCGSLNINVSPNNQSYCDIDGVLFTKDKKTLLIYAKDKIQPNYIIPDSVTSINSQAFEDCSGLTSISIPDSVTSIGNNAFFGCSSLTSISIPDSVTSIEIR